MSLHEERAWRESNKIRKEREPNRVKRLLRRAGQHPIALAAIIGLFILILWIACKEFSLYWLIPFGQANDGANSLAGFSAIWTIQATLAAVVYPIVIGFITLFLQQRSAGKAFIYLYLLESGAIAAGTSSLALVAVMGGEYLAAPRYGFHWLRPWITVDAMWLLFNALLTIYFVYITFEFLRDDLQQEIIEDYGVCEVLPREVHQLNIFRLSLEIQDRGWVPVPRVGASDASSSESPQVLIGPFAFLGGKESGTLRLPRTSILEDIRVPLLRLAVMLWMGRAGKGGARTGRNSQPQLERSALIVPLAAGMPYENTIPLFLVKDGPPTLAIERLLLRASLRFKRTKRRVPYFTTQEILDELAADARVAVERLNAGDFRRAFGVLTSFHRLLIGASLYSLADGDYSSVALLSSTNVVFPRPLHALWAEVYRAIFEVAVKSLPSDPTFFYEICNTGARLASEELQLSPTEIRSYLYIVTANQAYQLGEWWSARVEEQGRTRHGPNEVASLRPPFSRTYEAAMSRFVSGWEGMRPDVPRAAESNSTHPVWPRFSDAVTLFEEHLFLTSRMLLAAVRRGDLVASEWLGDVLMKWPDPLSMENISAALFGKGAFITTAHIRKGWEWILNDLALDETRLRFKGSDDALRRGVIIVALKNLWSDVRIVTIELLLRWADENPKVDTRSEKSLAQRIGLGLLRGEKWRAGGTTSRSNGDINAKDFLDATIRQYATDGQELSGYGGRFAQLVAGALEMEQPSMIPGRIYSSFGVDDISALRDEQLLLLALLSAQQWSASEGLFEQLEKWLIKQYQSVDVCEAEARRWIERLNEKDGDFVRKLAALLAVLKSRAEAEVCIEHLLDALRLVVGEIGTRRDAKIVSGDVDPTRLKQLAEFASLTAFRPTSGEFPLQLFEDVAIVAQPLQEFSLIQRGVRKGELTRSQVVTRAVNEKEYWARAMALQVGAVVLADVLAASVKREVYVPDGNSYWLALEQESARIVEQGGEPILLLENPTIPAWVWRWQNAPFQEDNKLPDGLAVRRETSGEQGYLCHFNGIAVYHAPIQSGRSAVLSRKVFNRVCFRDYGGGLLVSVNHETHEDSPLLVDLRFAFSRAVEVGSGGGAWLVYGDVVREGSSV